MRSLFIGSALVFGLLATAANAQTKPSAYCAQKSGSGTMTCIYATMAQCEAAVKGKGGDHCVKNPKPETTGQR